MSICLHICVCTVSVPYHRGQIRAVSCFGSRVTYEPKLPCGCWELSTGPQLLIPCANRCPFHYWPLLFSTCCAQLSCLSVSDIAFLTVAKNQTSYFERYILLCCYISLLNSTEEVTQLVRCSHKPEGLNLDPAPPLPPPPPSLPPHPPTPVEKGRRAAHVCVTSTVGWRQENPWCSLAS